MAYKPENYNSVSPYFVVDDAPGLIDFIVKVFGAEEKNIYRSSDGQIVHAEFKIDDSILMLANANEHYPAMNVLTHIYVPNVDETWKKAMAVGCESINAPQERPGDPNRRGTFKDASGNLWSVSTQKKRR